MENQTKPLILFFFNIEHSFLLNFKYLVLHFFKSSNANSGLSPPVLFLLLLLQKLTKFCISILDQVKSGQPFISSEPRVWYLNMWRQGLYIAPSSPTSPRYCEPVYFWFPEYRNGALQHLYCVVNRVVSLGWKRATD